MQTEAVHLPEASASFTQYHVELIAADIEESICRVSDTMFNAEANINIPTVDYEVVLPFTAITERNYQWMQYAVAFTVQSSFAASRWCNCARGSRQI